LNEEGKNALSPRKEANFVDPFGHFTKGIRMDVGGQCGTIVANGWPCDPEVRAYDDASCPQWKSEF
jgi:hypothetical protein